MSLDDASGPAATRAALAAGSPAEALATALAAWRRTRAPAIADAIDAIDRECRKQVVATRARTKVAFQAAWLGAAAADDVVTTGWLADTLGTMVHIASEYFGILDGGYSARKFATLTSRIAALATRQPDPRIARAAVALVRDAPFTVGDAAAARLVYGALVQLAVEAGDTRAIATFEELLREPRGKSVALRRYLADELPIAIATLRTHQPTLRDDERQAWQALAERDDAATRSRSALDGDAMLEQIRAHPDDAGLRLVYADWLLERGDPLGQLIMLGERIATGAATEQEHKQARALQRRHADEWLGPLGRVLRAVVFERGFVARAELAQNAAATVEAWHAASIDPRLATLRWLEQGRGNVEHYRQFVLSPMTRALTNLDATLPLVVEAVLASDKRLPLAHLALRRRPKRALLARMAAHPSLAGVRVLQVATGQAQLDELMRDLAATGWLDRVAELHVRPLDNWQAMPKAILAHWDALPPTVQRLGVVGFAGLGHERRR